MKQQYQIVKKKVLTPEISQISVHAPLVAAKAKAGQFIILRVDENGERIPLTISSADQENGTITVIFQKVGGTTLALDQLNEGDCLHDFVGPLGEPTHVEDLGRVAVLGGGLGGLLQRRCGLRRAGGQRDQGEGQGPGGEQGTDSFHVQFLLFAWFQENHTPSTKWKVKHLL